MILLSFLTMFLTSCKKQDTIENPIALGYIDDIPYIINIEGNKKSLKEYSDVKPYYGDYLMVKKNKKWSYIKNDGSASLKFKYDEVYPMSENKAVVRIDDTFHIINNLGNIVYTFTDGYYSNSYFKNNYLIVSKDDKSGYLKYNPSDNSFELIDMLFDYASFFNEGLASVGKLVDEKMKYTYLTTDYLLLNEDYIYESASDVSCGYGRVSTLSSGSLKYLYVKVPTSLEEVKTPSYLVDKTTSRTVSYDYGSDFKNNMVFVANYKVYSEGTIADNTRFYKDYTFIDVLGERNYDDALTSIAKPVPKSFFCYEPLFIDDVFCFINAKRSVPICNLIRLTKFKQITEDDTYTTFTEFKEVSYNILDDDKVLQKTMIQNEWTIKLARGYLTYPTEFKTPVFNETINSYILASKIYGNKWGFIKIVSTKITDEERQKNNLDDYNISLEYFIPLEFDYIIY